jgi:hypothetical protein
MRRLLARLNASREKLVLCLGLVLFAFTLFNAPWEILKRNYSGTVISSRSTTAPLWQPPSQETARLRVDVLAVQWVAIGIGCGGLSLLLRRRSR